MSRSGITGAAAIAVSALAGFAVAIAGARELLVLLMAVLLIVTAIVGLHLAPREGWRNPVATLLVATSVLAISWQGVQGPVSIPIADFPFLLALPLIGLALLRRQMPLLLPDWLLVVAGGLAVGGLLAAVAVPNPPDFVIGPGNPGQAAVAERQTDLALFLRTIYAMVLFPVLIAAVAYSWARARFFADVWLASTTICAAVACLDSVANAGIGNAVVTGLLPPGRAVGLTDQPNYLGQFTAMALPLAIVRSHQLRGLAQAVAIGSAVTLILALQLSGSRLGLLAALVGVGVLAALAPRVRNGVVVGGFVFVILAAASLLYQPGGKSAVERASGGDPTTRQAENARWRVIGESLEISADHLPTGVGFSRVRDSHSVPIQFLLAGGLIALVAFGLWVWKLSSLGLALAGSRRAPPASRELAAALVAALAAWLVPGIVNPQLLERFMYVPVGLLLAMGLLSR